LPTLGGAVWANAVAEKPIAARTSKRQFPLRLRVYAHQRVRRGEARGGKQLIRDFVQELISALRIRQMSD
jgi:hypothetical protein